MNGRRHMNKGSVHLKRLGMAFDSPRGPVEALRSVSLEIRAGEFISVLGPSGCGKSTLIAAISGLSRCTSGGVSVDGIDVKGPGPERAVVFQQHTLLPWKTVMDNVEFGLKLRGIPQAERKSVVTQMLAYVGLEGFEKHYPAQLSGGMQQRVNLARALVNRPRVLLMDEPFGALDAQTRLLMQELLLDLWSESRMTVLFVTHDVDEALFLSDRVVVLSRRPAEVRADIPVDLPRPRTAELLTHPRFSELKRNCLHLLKAEAPQLLRRTRTSAQGAGAAAGPLATETPAPDDVASAVFE